MQSCVCIYETTLLSPLAPLQLPYHIHEIGSIEASSYDIGVCYGMYGDNLLSPANVIALYKQYRINAVRLYDPNAEALQALKGSQLAVSLGTRNQDILNLASSPEAANLWFATNVAPYLDTVDFQYISVGNEATSGEFADYLTPAMQNLQTILDARQLQRIRITTAVSTAILGNSYPPSAGVFSYADVGTMTNVLLFLSKQGSPLMVNVYPYFAYASEPENIRLDYAQFTAPGPVVFDGELSYQNLFDAIVDAVFWAMEKVGVTNVDVVVSESGWPSDGNGNLTTPELAATYNKNFIKHTGNDGTPKRPQTHIEGYVFAMFNENLKPPGVEQNFGLFYAHGNPVYPPVFSPTNS